VDSYVLQNKNEYEGCDVGDTKICLQAESEKISTLNTINFGGAYVPTLACKETSIVSNRM
jgi:hypothetical protein